MPTRRSDAALPASRCAARYLFSDIERPSPSFLGVKSLSRYYLAGGFPAQMRALRGGAYMVGGLGVRNACAVVVAETNRASWATCAPIAPGEVSPSRRCKQGARLCGHRLRVYGRYDLEGESGPIEEGGPRDASRWFLNPTPIAGPLLAVGRLL